jgi:endonuclease/exonuclease/phosphatase family metal-dependent hydrolase
MCAADVAGGLVIASYNIHGCVGRDGRRDVARVARVIEQLDADVIALQEVDLWPTDGAESHGAESHQVDVLSHLVGLQSVAGPTMERGDGHFGNVVLTRLPIRAVRRLDLTFRKREPRVALDVDLDARGTKVRVIATHLGLLPSERRHQVQRILEVVSGDDEGLTVLLGDINEWLVYGRPLRWLHTRFGHCKGKRSYPAWFPLFALDRIWVHPSAALLRFEAQATPDSKTASDHLPVRAEVSLSGWRDAARDGETADRQMA